MGKTMKREEYIKELKDRLNSFDDALVMEIIDDCEAHFRAGRENGKTEEEICEELGTADEIAEELCQLYGKKTEKDFQSTLNHVVNDAINIAGSIAGCVVKEIKSGIDYGKRTWNERTNYSEENKEVERETKSCKLKKAVIDAGCGEVIVLRSNDEDFHIEYINEGSLRARMMFQFHGEEKGDCYYGYLSKKEGTSSLFQIINASQIRIILRVPEEFTLLEIKTANGDVRVEYADMDELMIASASGDLSVSNINVRNCLLKSSSGDICVEKGKGIHIKVRSASGDCSVNGLFFQQAQFKFENGDLNGRDIQITNFVANTKSGDLILDELVADSCIATQMSGDIALDHLRVDNLDLNTISGNIDIKLLQEIKANIHSISGDINVSILRGDAGYRAEVNTVSGEAILDFQGEHRYTSQKGIFTLGEGKSQFNVSSVSGDINIKN